jgi:hypothetical protein
MMVGTPPDRGQGGDHVTNSSTSVWPELPLSAWAETCDTLQLWTQVVGKIRLAHAPLINHWWQVALYVTSRGLGTSPIPNGAEIFEIDFDFVAHRLEIHVSDGRVDGFDLASHSVADFYREIMARLRALGLEPHIWTMPVEIEQAIPFERDTQHAAYDGEYATRFWRILVQATRLLQQFRSAFTGKVSPVHFFWGSFDLAVTRFSGRPAPLVLSDSPNLGRWVMQEAYSHEVSSCGFWPGNGGFGQAAFYSYAYPEPDGFADATVSPGAHYDRDLGQFILPYDAVRAAGAPDKLITDFLQRTYEAAASLGQWDRRALERPSPALGR